MTDREIRELVQLLEVLLPAIVCFVVLTWILWFLLPFAVFGIKERLDRIIALQEQILKGEKMPSAAKTAERIEPPVSASPSLGFRRDH